MPIGSESTGPDDRRLIFVGNRDAALAATVRASASTNLLVRSLRSLGPATLNGFVARKAAEAYYEVQHRDTSCEDLVDLLSGALDLGTPLTSFSPEQATALFKFGVGHSPRNGSLYVQHPVNPKMYVAPEEFSKTLAREKEAAFRQLASALGAKEIRLVTATVHTKRGLFNTTVSVPEAATEVGLKLSFDSKGEFVKQVYSKFGPPRSRPHVPSDLVPWVEMDSDLRTMARDRTEGHLLENRITLEFKEGMGVGGEVAAKVAGRGLTAGGSYSALSHSVWHFEAEYLPLD